MMYLDLKVQKRAWKKQLSCQLSSLNCFKEQGNLGKVFYFMAHLEQVKVFSLKLAQLNAIVLSFLYLRQIWLVNGKESLKDLLNSCLNLLEKKSHPWYSLMRLIHCVEKELKVKMNHQEEFWLNFWFKWMDVETIKKEFLLWVQQTHLGS